MRILICKGGFANLHPYFVAARFGDTGCRDDPPLFPLTQREWPARAGGDRYAPYPYTFKKYR